MSENVDVDLNEGKVEKDNKKVEPQYVVYPVDHKEAIAATLVHLPLLYFEPLLRSILLELSLTLI